MLPTELDNLIGSYTFNSTSYSGGVLPDNSSFSNDLELFGAAPIFTTRDIPATGFPHEVMDLQLDGVSALQGKALKVTDSSAIFVIHQDVASEVLGFYGSGIYPVANGNHLGTYDDTLMDWVATTYKKYYTYTFGTSCRWTQQSGGINAAATVTNATFNILTIKYLANPDKIAIAVNDGAFVEAAIGDLVSVSSDSVMRFALFKSTAPASDHLSMAEAHFFAGDVATQTNYATVITDLKTKYGL